MNTMENPLSKHRGWFITLAIVFIITGTLAIMVPQYASLALELILGWLFLFSGLFQIFHSFGSKSWGSWGWRFFGGLIYAGAGVVLLAYPLRGLITLTLILAILLTAQGVFRIIMSFRMRHQNQWGWVLISGLLALALGLMIYFKWPASSLYILGLFAGIDLIFSGWTMLMLGMAKPSGSLQSA